MKKTLLAAALLAGFAGAAQAQSSVTLYGLVDAGFSYTKEGGDKTYGIDSGLMSQSRWGLRGSEDLGNGLKAIFTLESGFSTDTGTTLQNGRLFGRYAFVGLESDTLGRLTLGRTTNLAFAWAANVANPFGLGFSRASIGSTFAYNDAVLGGGRADNSVYYYSPSFGGFQAAIGYSFNAFSGLNSAAGQEDTPAGHNNRLIDAGVRYANGPINAVLTYQQLESPLPGTDTFQNTTLAASYNFGVATVHAGYNYVKNIPAAHLNGYNGITATGGQITKDDAWTVGVSAPVGAGTAYGAYQKASKSKVDGWALGYKYGLSKRTDVYAFYADNDVRNFDTSTDESVKQFGLGLQHRF